MRIQLASLGIQIYDVIIYLDSLLLYNFGLCKLLKCNFMLCANFSLQFEWIYACFSSNFVSSIDLSLVLIFTWYQSLFISILILSYLFYRIDVTLPRSAFSQFREQLLKKWINITISSWLHSTTSNGRRRWRFWSGAKASSKSPWKLRLIPMQQQRISSGATWGMKLMVSRVSVFPEIFFSI